MTEGTYLVTRGILATLSTNTETSYTAKKVLLSLGDEPDKEDTFFTESIENCELVMPTGHTCTY